MSLLLALRDSFGMSALRSLSGVMGRRRANDAIDPEPTKTACSRQAKFRVQQTAAAPWWCYGFVQHRSGSRRHMIGIRWREFGALVGGSVGAVGPDTPNVGFDWAEVRYAATARTDGEKR